MNASFDIAASVARLDLSALGVLALAAVALLLSSYVKIATVLGLVRAGFGFQGIPSVFVTTGLALALSFFVMYPTVQRSTEAIDAAARRSAITAAERGAAIAQGAEEWRKFLERHAGAKEVERFTGLARKFREREGGDVNDASLAASWRVLAPAFFVTELREAFETGLRLLLPLLVIDLLAASILAAVGLEALNAHLVALPFKVLLFIAADGWSLITANLVEAYLK